jgi:hypothetical protein
MNTKSVLFPLLIGTILLLSSCEKDPKDSPGKIPGMGPTPGELEVKAPYTLPEGVDYVGQIHEIFDTSNITLGSGFGAKLSLTLCNATDEPKTVFFPKGLIWKCGSSENHNGILLQTAWVNIEPNSVKNLNILLYCINWNKPSPGRDVCYDIIGVSSSYTISNLLNIISWRKINYEMIQGTIEGVTPSSYSGPSYQEIIERLQNIVKNLTEYGVDISDEDRTFIESIPELSAAETPSSLDDGYQFPQFVVQ